MTQRMPRLINDIRRKRTMWALSLTLVVVAIAVCTTVALRRESARLRVQGKEYLSRIEDEIKPMMDLTPESVAEISSNLKSLSAKIGNVPEMPPCVSDNVMSFLVASRKEEFSRDAAALANEHKMAVSDYLKGIEDLQGEKRNISALITKLDDMRQFLLSSQYVDATRELRGEIAAFREMCDDGFIFSYGYDGRKDRLSKSVAKTQSLFSDSALGDFKRLSARQKEISDNLVEKVRGLVSIKRDVRSFETKLHAMPYDADNAKKVWKGRVEVATNAVMASSRDALQKLSASRFACAKALDAVHDAVKKSKGDVDLLREKFSDCVDALEVETVAGHGRRFNELRMAMDDAVASCRGTVNGDVENAMQKIGRLNESATKLLQGMTGDAREWDMLFDGLLPLETLNWKSPLELAIGRLTEIQKDARKLEGETLNEVSRVRTLAQSKWNLRNEKLYDALLAKHNEVMELVSSAAARLGSDQKSTGGEYWGLKYRLDALRSRSNSVSTQLRELKEALPKDATAVARFKRDFAAIQNESRLIRESLNSWDESFKEAVARAKPRIRLVAKLNGVEKRATVTRGIRGGSWVTPIDGIESVAGRLVNFAVEFTENGVKYIGEKEHLVQAGSQTVVIELRPEFTLPADFRFCGNCGNSLARHRHVRMCPFCHAELKR